MTTLPEAEKRFVLPYYLKMMGLNAAHADAHLDPVVLAGVTGSAHVVDHETVVRFLRSEWRPRVMGAWYAVCQNREAIQAELMRSLETSAGSLTAPPLAIAAAFLFGAEAIPSLTAYVASEAAARDGSGSFVQMVADHVAGRPAEADGRLDGYVERMLAIAAHIARGAGD